MEPNASCPPSAGRSSVNSTANSSAIVPSVSCQPCPYYPLYSFVVAMKPRTDFHLPLDLPLSPGGFLANNRLAMTARPALRRTSSNQVGHRKFWFPSNLTLTQNCTVSYRRIAPDRSQPGGIRLLK